MVGKIFFVSIPIGLIWTYLLFLTTRNMGQSYWEWADEWAEDVTGDGVFGLSGGFIPMIFVLGTFWLMFFFSPIIHPIISTRNFSNSTKK